jgi:hypothetical protein
MSKVSRENLCCNTGQLLNCKKEIPTLLSTKENDSDTYLIGSLYGLKEITLA